MGNIYLPRWWILQYRSDQQGHKLISSVTRISSHARIDHLPTKPATRVAGTAKALNAHSVPKFCPLAHLGPSLTPSHAGWIPVWKETNSPDHSTSRAPAPAEIWVIEWKQTTKTQLKPSKTSLDWWKGLEMIAGASQTSCSATLSVTLLGGRASNQWVSLNTAHCWIKELLPTAFQFPSLVKNHRFHHNKEESAPIWELKSVLLGKNPA